MNSDETFNLQGILDTTGAEAALIIDNEGNLIQSLNIDYGKNIAAMTDMAFKMCRDLYHDLNNGEVEQIIARAANGLFIVHKLDSAHIIILLSNDISKLGMLLKMTSNLNKN